MVFVIKITCIFFLWRKSSDWEKTFSDVLRFFQKLLEISWEVLAQSAPYTSWKVSKYGVIFGPYFPAFGLNTEIYRVNLRVESECREIQTRNNSVFGHFWRSVNLGQKLNHCFTCLFPNALYISLLHEVQVLQFKRFSVNNHFPCPWSAL